MDPKSTEFLYLGFLMPAIFAISLLVEGTYRILRREGGFFSILLGSLLLAGLAAFYFFILKR